MGKSSGSKTQSSNPKWLDDAGSELWSFAKNVVFRDPSDSQVDYSNPGANMNAQTVQATNGLSAPSRGGLPANSPNWGATDIWATKGSTRHGGYPMQSSGSRNPTMSMQNLRPLEQYSGERVAGPVNNQNRASQLAFYSSQDTGKPFDEGMGFARDATQAFGKTYNPEEVIADQLMTDMWSQEAADQYMNPFKKMALDVAAKEMERSAQIQKQRTNSGMVSKGAFGGSRHGIVESMLNRDLLEKTGDMYKTGLADAYEQAARLFTSDQGRRLQADSANQEANLRTGFYNEDNRFRTHESGRDQFNREKQRMLEAANTLGSLGTAKSNALSQDVERLLRTGETQRLIKQQQADTAYQDFLEARDYPYTQLERLSSIISNSPSQGRIQHQQKPNTLAQIGGLATGAASLVSAFSDRRLKKDIRRVGKKKGHNIYEFSYKGDKARYRGVMADEVKRSVPEAVIRDESGYDAVNYPMLGFEMERVA